MQKIYFEIAGILMKGFCVEFSKNRSVVYGQCSSGIQTNLDQHYFQTYKFWLYQKLMETLIL